MRDLGFGERTQMARGLVVHIVDGVCKRDENPMGELGQRISGVLYFGGGGVFKILWLGGSCRRRRESEAASLWCALLVVPVNIKDRG